MVASSRSTEPRPVYADKILRAIKSGRWEKQIKEIRRLFFTRTVQIHDPKAARLAVDPLKKKLPAILWSGRFSHRANDGLIQHSGLIGADLDSLGDELADVRAQLVSSQHVLAVFRSPTGKGLKVIFCVPRDAQKQLNSFRAVEKHVLDLTGIQIDQSRKDLAGMCFVSFDPELYYNPNATQIEPLPEPEKPPRPLSPNVDLNSRQRIAADLLGNIDWKSGIIGFVTCPGKDLHTTGDSKRDCKIELDGVPTVHCFHNSCRATLEEINFDLRSRIGKAEHQAGGQ